MMLTISINLRLFPRKTNEKLRNCIIKQKHAQLCFPCGPPLSRVLEVSCTGLAKSFEFRSNKG